MWDISLIKVFSPDSSMLGLQDCHFFSFVVVSLIVLFRSSRELKSDSLTVPNTGDQFSLLMFSSNFDIRFVSRKVNIFVS